MVERSSPVVRSAAHQPLAAGIALLLTCGVAVPAHAAQGTLQYGQRSYYPTGCVHNGNHAVCSFVLVNQGQLATLNAWAGELWGIQFVDGSHVPHAADTGYFVDQFGTHQPQLVVQRGDKGTFTLEFSNVDPGVTSGEFHFQNQIVAGIPVTTPNYNVSPNGMPQSGGSPQFASNQQMPQQSMAGMQSTYATQQPCIPQNGSTALCNANNKIAAKQNQLTEGANQMTQTAAALKDAGSTLKSLFGGAGNTQNTAHAQPAVQQNPATQLQQTQQMQAPQQMQTPQSQAQQLTPQQIQQLQLQMQIQQLQLQQQQIQLQQQQPHQ